MEDGIEKAIREYYEWQGDTNVLVPRMFKDYAGYPLYIARFTYNGKKYSSVVTATHDSHCQLYATELASCPREQEKDLIEQFKTPPEEDDYQ